MSETSEPLTSSLASCRAPRALSRAKVPLAAAALLLTGSLLPAPAGSDSAPSPKAVVGYVNVFRLQTNARIYGESLAEMDRRRSAAETRKALEREWRFLTGDKAARAVSLAMKGTARTPEETQEFEALRQEHSDLDLEWYTLKSKDYLDSRELGRLRDLQAIADARREELRQINAALDAELEQARQAMTARGNEKLIDALAATVKKHDLDVVLSSHVRSWQPSAAGDSLVQVWENVVLYGGQDVTDDVLATMNAAGPAPAPGENAAAERGSRQ
ncbi:MAG TPA: hypothetical protein PLD23_16985 [Armatimonadota bacterium]|nr:hypothetical protein [Armatimonadota bacterium]HQK95196.1 hypothetical protein [Armatimonadota bacterium]